AYPASHAGSVVGGGADLSVPDGLCTIDTFAFDPDGEARFTRLSTLVLGGIYSVRVETSTYLAFYVITGCDPDGAGPRPGQCPLLTDATGGGAGTFVATARDAYVVIDSPDPKS